MDSEPLYTPLFCEENIWQLARRLRDEGVDAESLWVLIFSNPSRSVVMLNQHRGGPGGYVVWDYHVVLQAGGLIYDLDTALPFPVAVRRYFEESFPQQSSLDEGYRGWLRCIPGSAFIERFHSDRRHMQGVVAEADFPPWPAITPLHSHAIPLEDYLEMHKGLDDGSRVMTVEEYVSLLRP